MSGGASRATAWPSLVAILLMLCFSALYLGGVAPNVSTPPLAWSIPALAWIPEFLLFGWPVLASVVVFTAMASLLMRNSEPRLSRIAGWLALAMALASVVVWLFTVL